MISAIELLITHFLSTQTFDPEILRTLTISDTDIIIKRSVLAYIIFNNYQIPMNMLSALIGSTLKTTKDQKYTKHDVAPALSIKPVENITRPKRHQQLKGNPLNEFRKDESCQHIPPKQTPPSKSKAQPPLRVEAKTINILSDSHGRHIDHLLRDRYEVNEFSINSIIMPGARLGEIMNEAQGISKSHSNFAVLIAGANDVFKGELNTFLRSLKPALVKLNPCKIIVGGIPFRRDLPLSHQINEDIMSANLYIHELSCTMSDVTFLDLSGFSDLCFGKTGVHLNYRGKKLLSSKIHTLISRKQSPPPSQSTSYHRIIPISQNISIVEANMDEIIAKNKENKQTAFAHCISGDFNSDRRMSAGVAVIFKKHFEKPTLAHLVNTHLTCQKHGKSKVHVYGMVTKEEYFMKPTTEDYNISFKQLAEDLQQTNIKELICSPLGCVRDKIKTHLFAENIVNLQQATGISIKIVSYNQRSTRVLFNGLTHDQFLKDIQRKISNQLQNHIKVSISNLQPHQTDNQPPSTSPKNTATPPTSPTFHGWSTPDIQGASQTVAAVTTSTTSRLNDEEKETPSLLDMSLFPPLTTTQSPKKNSGVNVSVVSEMYGQSSATSQTDNHTQTSNSVYSTSSYTIENTHFLG